MRVVVTRDKEYKGVVYVYNAQYKRLMQGLDNLDIIAELDMNESDIIYVVLEAGFMNSKDKFISTVPDFLYTGNPINVDTDLEKIKDCVESELESKKNINLTAFRYDGKRFKRNVGLMIKGDDRYAVFDCKDRDGFDELVEYYNRGNFRGKEKD